jgi:hypothetical protein
MLRVSAPPNDRRRDTMEYTDGTYKYLGQGRFEKYDREALGYWVSSTNFRTGSDATIKLAMDTLVTEYGADYVGIWTADDGSRYVDKTHYVRDREVAEAAGRHWNQQAIWDIANNTEILL